MLVRRDRDRVCVRHVLVRPDRVCARHVQCHEYSHVRALTVLVSKQVVLEPVEVPCWTRGGHQHRGATVATSNAMKLLVHSNVVALPLPRVSYPDLGDDDGDVYACVHVFRCRNP